MLHLLTSVPFMVLSPTVLLIFFFFFRKLRNECFATWQVRGAQFFAEPSVLWAELPPLLQHGFCPLLLKGWRVTWI